MARRLGSVEFKDGKYRARIRVDGKLKSLGSFATAHEADLMIDAYSRSHATQSPFVGDTLRAWGADWLKARELDKRFNRSWKGARSVWRARVDTAPFADRPLAAITARDVKLWVGEQLRTPSARTRRLPERQTVVNALNLLRVSLKDAVDADRIASNPAAEIRVPPVAGTKDKWTWLRLPEIEKLTGERVREDRRDVFTFAIYTGFREGEVFGLLWDDVDLHHGTIHVRHSWLGAPTKKGHIREVPMFAPALAAIRRQKERTGHHAYVWCSSNGDPHTYGYDADIGDWLRTAGVKRHVRFHDLRHTCASHLVSGSWGRPWTLPEVAGWLGHKSIHSTQRYAHLCPDGLKRAFLETPLSQEGAVPAPFPARSRKQRSPTET